MSRGQLEERLQEITKSLSTPSENNLDLYDLKVILENQIAVLDKRAVKLWEESEVGKKYEPCTFESFDEKGFERQLQIAKDFVKEFRHDSGQGLIFHGSYGTGKTHLAVAIARELLRQKGCSVWFKTFGELLQEIRNGFKSGTAEAISKRYYTVDVLVMDDLGKEKLSEWTSEQLFNIVNERYKAQKSMIITTNLNIAELNRRLDGAVMSRLVETCKAVEMTGKDYRLK